MEARRDFQMVLYIRFNGRPELSGFFGEALFQHGKAVFAGEEFLKSSVRSLAFQDNGQHLVLALFSILPGFTEPADNIPAGKHHSAAFPELGLGIYG